MPISKRFVQQMHRVIFRNLAAFLFLFPLMGFPAISAADGEGWYLDGSPVIQKSDQKESSAYFGFKWSISDGSANGSMSWKEESLYKCGGTYTGTVTWTPPPSFMGPGSRVNFTMSEKTSAQNTCGDRSIGSGGWIKVGGALIVEVRDSLTPTATGSYTVRSGSPGSKMAVVVVTKTANLNGSATYNYTYKGAGMTASTPTQPPAGTSRSTDDSGAVFSAMSGQVEIRPDVDKRWRSAEIKKGQTLPFGTHIKTSANSSVTIVFPNGDTFVLRPNTEIKIDYPINKKSRFRFNIGGLKASIERMRQDESLEIELEATAIEVKGTNFVVEKNAAQELLKVVEGKVQFVHKKSGKAVTVTAGQKIAATTSGLGQISTFDVAAEKASWADPSAAYGTPESEQRADFGWKLSEQELFDNSNPGGVNNGPTGLTKFAVRVTTRISRIATYHWNGGRGARPGEISLIDQAGQVYGPWKARGNKATQAARADLYWEVLPNIELQPGTYTVADSDRGTWSCNQGSRGAGMTRVEGTPVRR